MFSLLSLKNLLQTPANCLISDDTINESNGILVNLIGGSSTCTNFVSFNFLPITNNNQKPFFNLRNIFYFIVVKILFCFVSTNLASYYTVKIF